MQTILWCLRTLKLTCHFPIEDIWPSCDTFWNPAERHSDTDTPPSEQPHSLQFTREWAQMALQAALACPCNKQSQAVNSPRRSGWNPMKMKVISQSDLFSSALSGNLKLCAEQTEGKTKDCVAFVPFDNNTWQIFFSVDLSPAGKRTKGAFLTFMI